VGMGSDTTGLLFLNRISFQSRKKVEASQGKILGNRGVVGYVEGPDGCKEGGHSELTLAMLTAEIRLKKTVVICVPDYLGRNCKSVLLGFAALRESAISRSTEDKLLRGDTSGNSL